MTSLLNFFRFVCFRPALVASAWLWISPTVSVRLTLRHVTSAVNIPTTRVYPPSPSPTPPWDLRYRTMKDASYRLASHARTSLVTVTFSTVVCVWTTTVHSISSPICSRVPRFVRLLTGFVTCGGWCLLLSWDYW